MLIEKSLFKALKFFGNKQKLLAKAIGEKPDKIRYWLNKNGKIPFHNAIAIEQATKGEVSRYDLAPYARFKPELVLPTLPKQSISAKVSLGIAFENSLCKRKSNNTQSKNIYTISGRTDVLAAKHAGFGNHVSYRQAKKVIARGTHKLIQAIDAEIISVANAAILADLSPEHQEHILQHNKKQVIAMVKKIQKGEM